MSESLIENQKMLATIRSGKEGRDEVLIQLFNDQKLRNGFNKMIRSQKWSSSVFDQIFDQALIKFITTVIRRPDFELTSDLYNYIIVIGKHTWLKELKSNVNFKDPEDYAEEWTDDQKPVDLIIDLEKKDLIQDVLGRMGRNCKEVLMYWANSYNMKEIAKLMGYQSDMMARKKKYKCLKELTEYVEGKPALKSLLKH